MKLDLSESFEVLTRLQRMMGVTDEPELPAAELDRLVNEGIETDFDEIPESFEGVLTWRGQVVVLYIRDQYSRGNQPTGYRFHVAECSTLERMRTYALDDRYIVTSRADGRFPVRHGMSGDIELRPMTVCKNCLTRVDWDGYKTAGSTARQRIIDSFDIATFFGTYTNVRTRRQGSQGGAPPPVVPPPVAAPAGGEDESWAYSIEDEAFRRAALHLQRHRSLTDDELVRMVGTPRRARRFNLSVEHWFEDAPFRVQVVSDFGTNKSYRRVPR